MLQRLADEIESPELGGLHGRGHVGMPRNHDDRRGLDHVLELLQHFKAVHAWHLDVQEHQVRRFPFHQLDAFVAGGREHHFVALVLEDHLQRVANGRLVIDHEDAWFHRDSRRTVRIARASASGSYR